MCIFISFPSLHPFIGIVKDSFPAPSWVLCDPPQAAAVVKQDQVLEHGQKHLPQCASHFQLEDHHLHQQTPEIPLCCCCFQLKIVVL